MKKIKVLIADDHEIMRVGLATMLETDAAIKVVAEAADGTGTYKCNTKKKTAPLLEGNLKKKTVKIPATVDGNGVDCKVTAIADGAFQGSKKLTTLVIGKNVKKIGKNAFAGCGKLKTITIQTAKLTAKTIGAAAFKGIAKKPTVKLPAKQFKTYKKILLKRGVPKAAKFKK